MSLSGILWQGSWALAALPLLMIQGGPAAAAGPEELQRLTANIHWLGHDSFRIDGKRGVVYIDPYRLKEGPKADLILITHEHADHVRGAGILARRHGIPVYLTAGTHEAEKKHLGEMPAVRHVTPGEKFRLAGLEIRPFSTPHTSQAGRRTNQREGVADPVAYVFFHEGVKAGYATDLGHPIALMDQHLAGCRLLVLEFNHDPAMLAGL